MADRPILFSAPMVRALLDGRKTQTRRIIKPQPSPDVTCAGVFSDGMFAWMSGDPKDLESWMFHGDFKTPIQNGDRLWVRESHAIVPRTAYRMSEGVQQTLRPDDNHDAAVYAAEWDRSKPGQWRPSIHMPRWASRITLTVTEVRVERLQDISATDAIAEGIAEFPCLGPHRGPEATFWTARDGTKAEGAALSARLAFQNLWESINGERAWEANPWVAAYTFTVERKNIDEVPA